MAKFTAKTKDIKDLLDEQPKKTIMIPSNPNIKPEKDFKTVTINGYNIRIKCGEYVEVPESVAEILINSSKAIAEINKKYSDMTTGGGRNLSKPEPLPEE